MLPPEYRELAFKNILPYSANKLVGSMQIALGGGMNWWYNTNEGEKFWYAVYKHYKTGSGLPAIPKTKKYNKKKHKT